MKLVVSPPRRGALTEGRRVDLLYRASSTVKTLLIICYISEAAQRDEVSLHSTGALLILCCLTQITTKTLLDCTGFIYVLPSWTKEQYNNRKHKKMTG